MKFRFFTLIKGEFPSEEILPLFFKANIGEIKMCTEVAQVIYSFGKSTSVF